MMERYIHLEAIMQGVELPKNYQGEKRRGMLNKITKKKGSKEL